MSAATELCVEDEGLSLPTCSYKAVAGAKANGGGTEGGGGGGGGFVVGRSFTGGDFPAGFGGGAGFSDFALSAASSAFFFLGGGAGFADGNGLPDLSFVDDITSPVIYKVVVKGMLELKSQSLVNNSMM